MTNHEENQNQDPLERIAALKPEHQAIVPEHVVERAFNSKPKSRFMAQLTTKRTAWTALTAGVVAAISATAILPSALTASHTGYLFSANGQSAGAGAMADSKMGVMIPAFRVEYSAGSQLSTDGGSGHIYQLQAAGNPETIIKKLAAALKVEGKLVHTPASKENYSQESYTIGVDQPGTSVDGSTVSSDQPMSPSITLYVQGSGNQIYYSDPRAQNWQNCNSGSTYFPPLTYCDTTKFEAMPSAADATSTVENLLDEIGINSSTKIGDLHDGDYVLTHDYVLNEMPTGSRDQDLQVTASLVVEGKPTGVTISFGWSQGYAGIANVGGTVAKAVDRGSFDTVSASAAVARLNVENSYRYSGTSGLNWNDIKWSSYTYSGFWNLGSATVASMKACATFPDNWTPNASGDGSDSGSTDGSSGGSTTAVEPPVATDAPTDAPTAVATAEPSTEPTVEPTDSPSIPPRPGCDIPTDPKTGIALLKSTITRADQALVLIYGNDDNQWLVPGFDFYDETGYVSSVFSVVDGVIDISEPTVMPMDDGAPMTK